MSDCCFTSGNHWFRYRTAAIIIEDGKALFMENPSVDYLYTVGGGVQLGETSAQCVRREALEETGAAYEPDHLAVVCENFFRGNWDDTWDMDCQCLEFYYIMKPRGTMDLVCSSHDSMGNGERLRWIALEDLPSTNIKPDFLRTRLPEILAADHPLHIVSETDR